MSLSSLIVQREIATIRQVEEALARQVLYGGDLATNLLEVAPVEEWRIAVTFADSYSLPAAPPQMLVLPPAEIIALVPAEMASRRGIVPLSGNAQKLVVAASEPLTNEEVEQILAALGVRVDVRIALYVRVREALLQAYGIALDRRIERLLGKLAQIDNTAPTSAPSQLTQARPPSVPPFRLSPAYGISATRSPLAPQNRDETPSQPEVSHEEPIIVAPHSVSPMARSMRITQMGFPAPERVQKEITPAPPIIAPPPTPHTTGSYAETKPTFVKATSNLVRPVRRRRGPLTAETAAEELEEAADRDTLLDLFFEFARQFFDYAALFITHGDIAEGRDSSGDGAPRERVVGIGVPLDLPSMFATARSSKEALVVKPASDGVDGVLVSDLKRPAGVEALILPVLVRDRAVALLYADCATGIDRAAIAEVIAFAKSCGQAFERLIVRKKLTGFSGTPAATEAVGKIDTSSLPLPDKTHANTPPNEKATRAAVLGRALFSQGKGSDRPGAFRPPEPSPQQSPTNPETPQARGALPAVLEPSEVAADLPPTPVAPAVARARQHPSSRPPPPQAAAVHLPSNPPIPREDPEVFGEEPMYAPRTSAPDIEAVSLDDESARALLAEIGDGDVTIAEDGEEVLVEVPAIDASLLVPSGPESDQSVAVGPRRPPAAHSEPALPSIIVDISGELGLLVDRVLTGTEEGQAESELLRQGGSAMPAIMSRFPGPLSRSRGEIVEPLPRASDCGPLLRLIARQRKVALAYVLKEVASTDLTRRFWATFLLAELPYSEGARSLVPRLYDPDLKVRLVARAAARVMAEASHETLLGEIGRIVREPSTSRTARLGLLEALGDMREGKAVALLIGHLADEDAELATVARRALIVITRQDHALDTRKWLSWWGQNSSRHRVEWLIDALVDETPGIRRAAGDELKTLTQETFGYYDDLPKRERERAQQRFRDWWASEGRARFVRSL